jgi:hypothetical protein
MVETGGKRLVKRVRNRRPLLCFTIFGIFFWTTTTHAHFISIQDQSSVTKPSGPKATAAKSGVLVEEFSFLIKDFKVQHQTQDVTLNISILLRYKSNVSNTEYLDFRLVAKDIEELLANYPNEQDYWEIVNKKLTLMVLAKYPVVAKIISRIDVSPTTKVLYSRSSIVTRDRTTIRKSARSTRTSR